MAGVMAPEDGERFLQKQGSTRHEWFVIMPQGIRPDVAA